MAGALVFYSGNYRIIFLPSVFPYIAGLLLMISYPNELNTTRSSQSEAAPGGGLVGSLRETIRNFLGTFKDPSVVRALFNSSFFDGLFKSVKDYLQPILKSFALSLPILLWLQDIRSTIIISVTYFVLYILTSVSSRNAHRVVRGFKALVSAVNVSFLAGVVLTVMAGVLYGLNISIVTIVIFVLLHLFMNFRRPITFSYVSDYMDTKVMATGVSVESQLKIVLSWPSSPRLWAF